MSCSNGCLQLTGIVIGIPLVIVAFLPDIESNTRGILFSVGLLLVFIGITAHIYFRQNYEAKRSQSRKWIESIPQRLAEVELFADYLCGFAGFENANVSCGYIVTKEDIIFYFRDLLGQKTDLDYAEIGRIRRDSISSIDILDHSQFTKKIEMGALLLLGPFGLGAQTTEEHLKYYLIIRFIADTGEENKLLFVSKDISRLNTLLKYKLRYKERLSDGVKYCPFCAEVIKAKAIKCRFCGSDLIQNDEN